MPSREPSFQPLGHRPVPKCDAYGRRAQTGPAQTAAVRRRGRGPASHGRRDRQGHISGRDSAGADRGTLLEVWDRVGCASWCCCSGLLVGVAGVLAPGVLQLETWPYCRSKLETPASRRHTPGPGMHAHPHVHKPARPMLCSGGVQRFTTRPGTCDHPVPCRQRHVGGSVQCSLPV